MHGRQQGLWNNLRGKKTGPGCTCPVLRSRTTHHYTAREAELRRSWVKLDVAMISHSWYKRFNFIYWGHINHL